MNRNEIKDYILTIVNRETDIITDSDWFKELVNNIVDKRFKELTKELSTND